MEPCDIMTTFPDSSFVLVALVLGITTMTFDSITELEKISEVMSSFKAEEEEEGSLEVPLPLKPDVVLRLRVPDDHSVFKLGYKTGNDIQFMRY